MTTCTTMKTLSDTVENFITQYEAFSQDETMEGIDSTPSKEILDTMYAYRKAIKENDREYIKNQGIVLYDRQEQGKLLSEVFKKTVGSTFTFYEGNSKYPKNGIFEKAEFTDGGIAIKFYHKNKAKRFTFSLNSDERSQDFYKDKEKKTKPSFIRLPEYRSILDNFYVAEKYKLDTQLILGSEINAEFTLKKEDIEDSYVHGNTEHMKNMLKKLHILGGEKASDKELEHHLELIEKMNPSFFEKLKLYVKADAEKSQGAATTRRIDIKIKGDPISIGNQQSEASIYMEEVVHSMTKGALDSNTIPAQKLKRRLQNLIELARKQLTIEDFLPPADESIDPKTELEFAEKLYDYIMEDNNKDYEFLAKGITQPLVMEALSKVKVKDTKENATFLEKLMSVFSFVLEVLQGAITLKNKNQNVHDALIDLAIDLGEINTKASQKALEAPGFFGRVLDLVLNDSDRKLAQKLHEITESTVEKAKSSKYEKMPDDLYGKAKMMAKTIGLSMVNPTYTKVMGAVASSLGAKPDGTIREIIGGLFQTEPVQKAAEFLVLQAGLVDKYRNQQIALTRDNVLKEFKETPTKVEEEAITTVISDTDLASLFGKNSSAYELGIVKTRVFNNETLRKILTNEDVLDSYIVEAKRALKDLDRMHYHWHSNQAVGLGIYMATHQGTPEQNLNATNIAKGIHSSHRKAPNKKVVKAIDELATLVALKNTDKTQRDLVADIMKKEWKGVQHVADVVEGFKVNSIETVFKNNQTNMIKGYSREVFDDSIIVEVAPLEDKESMEKQGFVFKGKLAPKVGDKTKKPMALYVTDSFNRPERLRGGIRMNQIRSKGQTITSLAYKELGDFSNSLIRETAQREINSIQADAIKRAKKMEEGEYDFKDTVFGVMPILNENGKVVDYRYMMDKKTKKSLLKQDTRISEVMAKSFGTLLDKEASNTHNKKVLEEIVKDMKENWEEGDKGKDGLTDFTLVGPKVADPEMRKLYSILPKEFKEYINTREDKTLAVRTSLKNLYFGYSHLSIMDFPLLKKITPQILQKAIRFLGTVWVELVQIAKTNILMKMPTVTISNFLSNFLYLTMKGYNPVETLKLMFDSFQEIKNYNKNKKRKQELLNRKQEITIALNRDVLPEKRKKELLFELKKVKGEITSVGKNITGSRINELVELGLDQTVEDISSGSVRDTNKISQFFEEKLENVPNIVRTGLDYLFITKRTPVYKTVSEFLEITDLMSRDVQNVMEKRSEQLQADGKQMLPSWWLDKQKKGYSNTKKLTGEEKVQFLKEAEQIRKYELVEDYINYALPSSKFEEYLNRIGILMFTKYVKRIQRIIAKTGSRGPIKTGMGIFGAGVLLELPTIHEQSFLAKEWYTDSIGPGNVFPIYSPIDIFMNVITPSLLKESTYTL